MIKNNNIYKIQYYEDINEICYDNRDKLIITIYFNSNNDLINNKLLEYANNHKDIIILIINLNDYDCDERDILEYIPYIKMNNYNEEIYNEIIALIK